MEEKFGWPHPDCQSALSAGTRTTFSPPVPNSSTRQTQPDSLRSRQSSETPADVLEAGEHLSAVKNSLKSEDHGSRDLRSGAPRDKYGDSDERGRLQHRKSCDVRAADTIRFTRLGSGPMVSHGQGVFTD